jgi:glycosyltransferase involved in cell wall biosynthesis
MVETRKRQIPLIYEVDDLLFELPADHNLMKSGNYSYNFLPMLMAIKEADLVTVSTQPIADYLKPFNKNIIVLPNYLIDDFWNFQPIKRIKQENAPITIGYVGGSTHTKDVENILAPLLRISELYQNKIQFLFWGMEPPIELTKNTKVKARPIIENYEEYAKEFVKQDIDVLIAPLQDIPFNRAKSNLKFLEYSTLGVPGIFSKVRPYEEIVDHGVNGFLASTPQEWYEYLQTLIDSPEIRIKLAENAQRTVRTHYMLSQHFNEWSRALESIDITKRARITPNVNRREKILQQIFIKQNKQYNELKENNNKFEELLNSGFYPLIKPFIPIGRFIQKIKSKIFY